MLLKLLAFVLPLGLDSFAVAAALGAAGAVTVPQRHNLVGAAAQHAGQLHQVVATLAAVDVPLRLVNHVERGT